MLALHIQQPYLLLLLVLLPLAVAIFTMAEHARGKSMFRFAGGRETSQDRQRLRRFHFICTVICMGLVIMALTRPAFRKVPHLVSSEGRDLVFLLDVSRSMLAEDLHPNRLDAAKQAILDCVEELQGDRVGLVAFAGSSSILCPLTTDYPFFKDKLAEVQPESVYQGGTRIGDAIQKTVDKVLTKDREGFQDVILISDGGDQESRPENAAKELEELGVYFIVVGVGDPKVGARVPARADAENEGEEGSKYTMFDGQEVWSKLETASLEALARACRHGVFLEAGRRVLPLGEIYPELVKHFRSQSSGRTEEMMDWEETFPIILALALTVLLIAPLFYRKPMPASATTTTALILTSLLMLPSPQANAQDEAEMDEAAAAEAVAKSLPEPEIDQPPELPKSPVALYNKAHEQMEAQNFAGTIALFMQAAEGLEKPGQRVQAIYNAGVCNFRQADVDALLDPQSALVYYSGAIRAFRACLDLEPNHEEALWNLELSLLRKHFIMQEMEQDQNDQNTPEESEQDDSSQEGESENSEMEDEEGEWEESDEEGASEPTDQSTGPNSMDLESQDIPPPMVDPEDLLQQEMENRQLRQKQQSSKYKAVEKDW